MKKWLKKRGLSTVITTLILIAVSLVVIVGVGIFIKNFTEEEADFITADGLTLDVQIMDVEVLSDTNMSVKVKRNPGGNNIAGVIFVVYDESNTEVHKKNVPLEELERKDFEIILQVLNTSHVHKITVSPIYETNSGKEVISPVEHERIVNPSSGGGSSSGGSSTPDPEPETNNNCDLTSATWSKNLATEGEEVLMNIAGTDCDGRIITFEIFDKDGVLDSDDQVSTGFLNLTFNEDVLCSQCISNPSYYWCPSENTCNLYMGYPTCLTPFVSQAQGSCPTETPINNHFSFKWNTIYEEDFSILGDNNPEYYFVASVSGSTETIESSNERVDDPLLLIVEPRPPTCTDGIQNQGEDNIDCGGPCDSCIIPNVYWQYNGNEVTVLNDIEYGNWISLVMEDTGLEPGTGVDFEIYDYDSVGDHDYLGTTSYYVGSAGDVFASWRFGEAEIDAARDFLEGDRLELYFIANGVQSPELDINFIEIIEETCTDGIQNQDEGGIDCGGSCGPCFNFCDACVRAGDVWCVIPGIDEFCAETELECDQNEGLVPVNCENCFDGEQNQDEEGIDCGGVCKACQTCDDGIQNQQELMVDCGGPNCPSCECVYGTDCPTDWDCVRGFCDKCDSTTSGFGCSDRDFYEWEEGTCVRYSGSEPDSWHCRRWASMSYDELTGEHHFQCGAHMSNYSYGWDKNGWPCEDNEIWESSGDFVAEGICVTTNPICDSNEVAMHNGPKTFDPVNADPWVHELYYYEDCLRVEYPRERIEGFICDTDVTSPTLGFFPNGECYCGTCFSGDPDFDETPCITNYRNLDLEIMRDYMLERINWEKSWLGNYTVDNCNLLDPVNCGPQKVYPLNTYSSIDQELSAIAALNSQEMADNDYLITYGEVLDMLVPGVNSEGLIASDRIDQAGYSKECNYVIEVYDKIYVHEGVNEYELVDHLLYGGRGDTYGHWLYTDPWFGNLHRYMGEGPNYLGDEWSCPDGDYGCWMFGNIFKYGDLVRAGSDYEDIGIGFAMADDGQLYVTVTQCYHGETYTPNIQTFPLHEDWQCSYSVNRPKWCDCDYNNDPRCYWYYSDLEKYGSEDAMEAIMVSLRRFCEGGIYDQTPDLVCSNWNPFNEISWEYRGSEVTEISSISVPSVLTLRVQSQRLVEGEIHSFEIYDEDALGDDHLGTVSGTVEAFGSNNYVVSATWTFNQDVIDDADNLGEGDTLELYFTLLDVESEILEVGF